MTNRSCTDGVVYIAAAVSISDAPGRFVTHAIAGVAGLSEMSRLSNRMAEYFDTGWADWSHQERILALCFMAAMVEAGDA